MNQQPGQGPKERILTTALELFVEKGYFNTNIPDISSSSKCSVGSIYHHFLNKEEIASHLYEVGIKKFRSAITEVIDINEHPKKVFKAIVIAFLYFSEHNKSLAKYLWLARHNEFLSRKVTKPTVVGFDILGRQLTKVIKKAIHNGDIAPLNAEVIWTLIFGLSLSYILDWLDGTAKVSPSEIAPVIAEASWSALTSAKA
ncbi:MAG: TetR/AcrR family transcriptional regulator [Deltaproteobacteria bacterium]|jgi:AcrR family transcriptional regulator|nr:TetR/AcrR family transcriptional regulator [Deltaproteobacteria bacterium]